MTYSAPSLPEGAMLDPVRGVLGWVPSGEQLGPHTVNVNAEDDGTPPLSAGGSMTFAVSAPSPCRDILCDPAVGCAGALLPIGMACCQDGPVAPSSDPVVSCPDYRVLHLGRNLDSGFGRLFDCDRMRVINFGQIGATVRFNLEARCLNTSEPVTVFARMRTASRVLFDGVDGKGGSVPVLLKPADNGFSRRTGVSFAVLGPGPFFEFEGAEAELVVRVRDVDGVEVAEEVRVMLTFDPLEDGPDLPR